MSVFQSDYEAESYRLLHTDRDAWFAKYRAGTSYALNRWAARKLLRFRNVEGSIDIITYKKYANEKRRSA